MSRIEQLPGIFYLNQTLTICMVIKFQYYSNDSSVPPQNNNQQATRLSDDAVPAKDTESWQAGLDQNLPGIPIANYITKSKNDASENVTKV